MHDGHDHSHPFQLDHDRAPATPYEVLEQAVRELLVEKGVLTPEEIAEHIDGIDSRAGGVHGTRVVARAWADPAFKQRLLDDCRSALLELDIDIGELADFVAIENTPDVHNVVVCTLCSCYPKTLLGIPPAWYKSLAYRSRTVREPRAVLKEFGTEIPESVDVHVHDSTADLRYFIIPERPAGTEGWSEEQLAEIVTRDCMIGTARPRIPVKAAAE
ncbi:MAG: nitrile hydratase subunit alpha [Hyphomicrobiaceae bacterium]